jgi:hypothetical protein
MGIRQAISLERPVDIPGSGEVEPENGQIADLRADPAGLID